MRFCHVTSLPLLLCPLLLLQVTANAQECSQIDKNHPLQYITYEHFQDVASSKTGTKNKLVWLRLHNNSSCRILMRATETPLTLEAVKQPQGGIKLVPLDHLREGAPVELVYKILDHASKKEPVYGTFTHYTYGFLVLPGGTLTFSVPVSVVKQNQIIVPFGYEWEDVESHKVSFFDGDLPRKLAKK
jgi:hypothetical protein